MRCFTLSDGKYMVEVPVNKGVMNLMLTPDALMRNFQLDTLPVETVFDAEPRDVQDYMVRPQSPRNKTHKATDQDSQEKRLNDDFDRFNLRPKIYTK